MWQEDLAKAMNEATPSERNEVLAEFAAMTTKSVGRLRQIAKEHGHSSGRKKRSDKGVLRSEITKSQIKYIVGLILVTSRDNKGAIMPVARAIQVAEDSGIIEKDQISTSGMNRIMRELSLSKKALKAQNPHTQMRSLYPNHVHVVDVSVCIQYYISKNKLAIMDEKEFYKNKPENYKKVKTKLMRYVIVDHFSSAFFVYYYNTGGESALNLFDFLCRAWAGSKDSRFPFKGVPELLLMDRGSANKAKITCDMLARLGVGIPEGNPYNPRRQGAVESTHNIVEGWFESSLRIEPSYDMEKLNSDAADFFTRYHETRIHTRHKETRNNSWRRITPDQLRILPPLEVMKMVYEEPEVTRTVDGTKSISVKTKDYKLGHIPGLFRGSKVIVAIKPYEYPNLEVRFNGASYLCEPFESFGADKGSFDKSAPVFGEEYKSPTHSLTQTTKKEMMNEAYGEDGLSKLGEPKKGAIPYEGAKVFGHHAETLGNITSIPNRGEEIDLGELKDQQVSIMELFKRLNISGVNVTTELNSQLREKFGKSIGLLEIETFISEYKEGVKDVDSQSRQAG